LLALTGFLLTPEKFPKTVFWLCGTSFCSAQSADLHSKSLQQWTVQRLFSVLDDADAPLATAACVAIAEIMYLTTPNSCRKMYNTTDKGKITQLQQIH